MSETQPEPLGACGYELHAPYRLGALTEMTLEVRDPGLLGAADRFIRLDLYPRTSPIHSRRHYGWWDIPLARIRTPSTRLVLDLRRRVLRLKTGWWRSLRLAGGFQSAFGESGYGILHASLWDSSGHPPRMRAVKSYDHLLAGADLDVPLKQIYIPVTDRCNLLCAMCPRTPDRDRFGTDMPDDVLRPLLEAVPQVSGVVLMALGEPLLYPGLVPLVARVKGLLPADGEVGLTTNAMLLDETMAADLLRAGPGFIFFSVDGATKAIYEKIRVGADFGRVTENIARAAALRKTMGSSCRFQLGFVMQRENVHEIPAYAELAARLGVENVTYCHYMGPGGVGFDAGNTFGEDVLAPLFDQARAVGRRAGVNLNFPPMEPVRQERCFCMERVILDAHGEVFPCPRLTLGYCQADKARSFGNVTRRTLREIWSDPLYRDFRRRVLAERFPDECRQCQFKRYLVP
jgi:radical SAM protein with 4Fe4S-binding SPASM domain